MSKQYAYVRLYTKAYHCARDSIAANLQVQYWHRAYYLQGIALVYTGRLELAIKCLSLALRSHFQSRFSQYLYQRQSQTGVLQMMQMDQIATYLESNPEALQDLNI